VRKNFYSLTTVGLGEDDFFLKASQSKLLSGLEISENNKFIEQGWSWRSVQIGALEMMKVACNGLVLRCDA
jgi:hypothetical protein